MPKERFQLTREAATSYESQKVRAVFAPLARATLDAIAVTADEVVLDVACGTGIVGRVLAERCRLRSPIVGIDLNIAMIERARDVSRADAAAFRWLVGDVANLPLADRSFSLAFCQQGLQYFPDEGAALRELRRVLRPGGRVALTLWATASPFFVALADAIGHHVSPEAAQQSLAPFDDGRAGRLPGLLAAAGFAEISVNSLTVDRIVSGAREAIPQEIMGNPVGTAVAALGETVMSTIVGEVIAACADYRHGADLIVPQKASLFTAIAR